MRPVPQVPLVQADLRAHKAHKVPLVRRARPVSVAKPARQARKGSLVLKVRREKLVHRGQRGRPANVAKLDRKAPQVPPVRQDHPAPRAAQHGAQALRARPDQASEITVWASHRAGGSRDSASS